MPEFTLRFNVDRIERELLLGAHEEPELRRHAKVRDSQEGDLLED